MKNLSKIIGIIALAAVIMFSMTACPEDDNGGGTNGGASDAGRWSKLVDPSSTATLDYSVAGDDVCTVTIGGIADPTRYKASARYLYTAKVNTSYTYVFEAWTETGTRTLNVQYYIEYPEGWVFGEDNDGYLSTVKQINSTRATYTIIGEKIPKGGERNLEFQCADRLGKFYVKVLAIYENEDNNPPENWPVEELWSNAVASTSTATLEYFSVATDGVCTVTVGGVAESNDSDGGWNAWRVRASYHYTARENASYTYVIEAWTKEGERNLHLQYYDLDEIYLEANIGITTERKEYRIQGQNVPKGGKLQLHFQCADQLGTFYVKVLSIEAAKTLNIQNNWGYYYTNTIIMGIFQAGTTLEQALEREGLVAYASSEDVVITGSGPYGPYTFSGSLYDSADDTRWTGSGTFDVYLVIGSSAYKAGSVNFSSGNTYILRNKFEDLGEVEWTDGGDEGEDGGGDEPGEPGDGDEG